MSGGTTVVVMVTTMAVMCFNMDPTTTTGDVLQSYYS
jgi:hypothetical protein